MSKFILFYILAYLLGNPLLALLVLVAAVYFLDRNTLRILPDWTGRLGTWSRIRSLKRTVALNPDNAGALVDLGRILTRRGDFSRAIPYLERAMPKMTDSDEADFYLGFACLRTGRLEEARKWLEKCLEVNPRFGYGEPHLRLGEYYQASGDLQGAAAELEKFTEIHSSSSEGFYRQGKVLEKLGEKDRAARAFRRAIEVYRSSPRFKRKLDRHWAWKARWALWFGS
jgi:tetratricopeptide (TPR) repeat protein